MAGSRRGVAVLAYGPAEGPGAMRLGSHEISQSPELNNTYSPKTPPYRNLTHPNDPTQIPPKNNHLTTLFACAILPSG